MKALTQPFDFRMEGGTLAREIQTKGKTMKWKLASVMLSGFVLIVSASAAIAASDPIPGIDIIVKKKPGPGIIATVVSDERGRFSVLVSKPGRYTVASACPAKEPRNVCPRHQLSISASGKPLLPGPDGSYDFSVAKGDTGVLTGVVEATPAGSAKTRDGGEDARLESNTKRH